MSHRKIIIACVGLLAAVALAAPGVDVKNPKIAYVDTETAINNSKEYKDCSLAILNLQDEKEEELRKLTAEIDALGDKLRALSEAQRQKEEVNYQALISRAQRFAEDTDRTLQEQRTLDINRIANKLKAVIEDAGKSGGYTLVLDLKAIVYLDRAEMKNLTDDVVLKLNEDYAKEKSRLNQAPTRVK